MNATFAAVMVVATGVLACGDRGDRAEREPEVAANQLEFRMESIPQNEFGMSEIATVGNQLWIRTTEGMIAIDPVAERWTRLYADAEVVRARTITSCVSRLWFTYAESLVVVDPGTRQFEKRPARIPPPLRATSPIGTRCGAKGVWTWDGASLYHVPLAGDSTVKFEVPRFPVRDSSAQAWVDYFEVVGPEHVYFLVSESTEGSEERPTLLRFNPATSQLTGVATPPDTWGRWLGQSDEGLVLQTEEGRFLLRGDGQWVDAPRRDFNPKVLATGDQVVWVGASYDVSPGSYFVVRYIRDAMAPKDLVILTGYSQSVPPGSAVHHLGMLWMLSGETLLRIDPTADELVRYRLKQTDGELERRTFSLKQAGIPLLHFDGDTLLPFGTRPAKRNPADPNTPI